MANIEKALSLLWKVEFSNNASLMLHNVKNDAGGMTYCGIARKYHDKWIGWNYIDEAIPKFNSLKEVSKNLIDCIPLQKLVKQFYQVEFWDSIKGSSISKQAIASEMFLSCVNIGIKPCIKLAQTVIDTKVDGLFGINTLTAINNISSKTFCTKYTDLEILYYKELVRRKPSNQDFLNGWIARSHIVDGNNAESLDVL